VELFRLVLIEILLLAVLGGLLGAGLAYGTVKLLKIVAGPAIPRLDAVSVSWPALGFCLGTSALAAALAGLVPAFRMSQLDPVHGLKSAGPSASAGRADRRLLRGVAVLQTALTLALLVGAGLLIRTVNKLARVRLGYDTENILTMNVTDINGPNFFTFHDRTLARISALPGVKQVAFAWGVPLTGNKWMTTVKIGGESDSGKFNDALWIPLRSVTPEYFELMGQHVLSGRNFPASHSTETNRAVMPSVAVVNEAMAKRYFPQVNPIGRMLRMPGREDKPIEIIGVVANARTEAVVREPEPEIYFCLWEAFPFTKHLLIRTASNPRPLFITVQRELRAIEPTVAIENVKTLEQIRSDSVAPQTFAMRLLEGFSFVACALALVGIYGVLSLSVSSRKREIAIRNALGAQRRDILALVLREGFRLIAVGLLLGAGLAIILARALRTFLFEVQPTDPLTLLGVVILFAAVALPACYLPGRRATKVDPMEALRYE